MTCHIVSWYFDPCPYQHKGSNREAKIIPIIAKPSTLSWSTTKLVNFLISFQSWKLLLLKDTFSLCLWYDFDVTLYEILGLYSSWKNKNILMTKITIINSNVKSVLAYGCGTWEETTKIRNKLQTLVDRYLWRRKGKRWPKILRNIELWEAAWKKLIIL
jgi:hypothetical protein